MNPTSSPASAGPEAEALRLLTAIRKRPLDPVDRYAHLDVLGLLSRALAHRFGIHL